MSNLQRPLLMAFRTTKEEREEIQRLLDKQGKRNNTDALLKLLRELKE